MDSEDLDNQTFVSDSDSEYTTRARVVRAQSQKKIDLYVEEETLVNSALFLIQEVWELADDALLRDNFKTEIETSLNQAKQKWFKLFNHLFTYKIKERTCIDLSSYLTPDVVLLFTTKEMQCTAYPPTGKALKKISIDKRWSSFVTSISVFCKQLRTMKDLLLTVQRHGKIGSDLFTSSWARARTAGGRYCWVNGKVKWREFLEGTDRRLKQCHDEI